MARTTSICDHISDAIAKDAAKQTVTLRASEQTRGIA
jgi:hypothetical protein